MPKTKEELEKSEIGDKVLGSTFAAAFYLLDTIETDMDHSGAKK